MLFGLVGERRRFKVDVASASECGLVRKDNQDHLVADPKTLVFCVADGMGGGEGCGGLRAYAETLLEETDAELTVVCGRNEKLQEQLDYLVSVPVYHRYYIFPC